MNTSRESGDNLPAIGQKLVEQVLDAGIYGVGPLKGAKEVGEEYDGKYGSGEEAIKRLVRTHTRLAATEGFVKGVGGLITLPISLPSGITGFYVISSRMVASIAHLRGYNIDSDEVRTGILVCLVGGAGVNAAKQAGVEVGKKFALAQLRKVPGSVLIQINKAVGFRLVTKFGQKGVVNLHKGVPLVGGLVGATVDGFGCRGIGRFARSTFPPIPAE